MSNKTHIYFMPGLAAGSKIFDHIRLPKEKFEFHFLEWLIPDSLDENLEHYVKRLSKEITHVNPILIGVSFGGIIVQEMSKLINPEKVILISSIKHQNEFPKRLKFFQKSRLYKLFPTKKIAETTDFSKFKLTKSMKKKAELYEKFLTVKNEKYLNWAIYNMLNWKSSYTYKGIIHIHGNKDHVFPIKHIKNCIIVEGGTHEMILSKSKKINTILQDIF